MSRFTDIMKRGWNESLDLLSESQNGTKIYIELYGQRIPCVQGVRPRDVDQDLEAGFEFNNNGLVGVTKYGTVSAPGIMEITGGKLPIPATTIYLVDDLGRTEYKIADVSDAPQSNMVTIQISEL